MVKNTNTYASMTQVEYEEVERRVQESVDAFQILDISVETSSSTSSSSSLMSLDSPVRTPSKEALVAWQTSLNYQEGSFCVFVAFLNVLLSSHFSHLLHLSTPSHIDLSREISVVVVVFLFITTVFIIVFLLFITITSSLIYLN